MSTTTLQCESIDILNQQFADAIDLRHQVMQARWGAKRSNCLSLSRTFDQVGHQIERFIDLIAERMLDLGAFQLRAFRLRRRARGFQPIRARSCLVWTTRVHSP